MCYNTQEEGAAAGNTKLLVCTKRRMGQAIQGFDRHQIQYNGRFEYEAKKRILAIGAADDVFPAAADGPGGRFHLRLLWLQCDVDPDRIREADYQRLRKDGQLRLLLFIPAVVRQPQND